MFWQTNPLSKTSEVYLPLFVQRLLQSFQDSLRVGPTGGVLADALPRDVTVCVDDEHGWGGISVAQQVVHAVSLGHFVVGVGQHLELCLRDLSRSVHRREGGDGQCDDLGSGVLKGCVIPLQLHELRAVGSSAAFLEKDQHHRTFG